MLDPMDRTCESIRTRLKRTRVGAFDMLFRKGSTKAGATLVKRSLSKSWWVSRNLHANFHPSTEDVAGI